MKSVLPRSGNQLLACLPRIVLARLKSKLQAIDFDKGRILYEAKSVMEYAYFPTRGALSAVVVMRNGNIIEVGTIGNEGAVGLPMSSVRISPHRVFVQVPGAGLRIATEVLTKELRGSAVKRAFEIYQAAFLFQVSQSVACNGLHAVHERCCRWLLMNHDRVEGNEILLTHEFLAAMLGVRRASVTDVLHALQERGLIKTARSKIIVLDRASLEAGSCECYQEVRDAYA